MRFVLFPLGLVYGLINSTRRRLYETGFFRAHRLPKPVISVGNLTAGGTGKTPFVDALLGQLEGQGLKCGVLTRGYGRKSSETLLVGESTTAEDAGDEPLWLFRRHPQAKIAVGADRVAASKLIENVDVFILDDGLQHLQIHRDFEITLIDATRPLAHYHPIPWGYGRESFKILNRSDLVVLTRSNQATVDQLDIVADVIFKNGVFDLIEASVELDKIYDLKTGNAQKLENLKTALVSAVGNPESFENLMKTENLNIAFHEKKTDHWNYTQSDISNLEKKALSFGVQSLVTTEKDGVKIQKLIKGRAENPLPWTAVSIKMKFDPELPNIYDLVSHSSH